MNDRAPPIAFYAILCAVMGNLTTHCVAAATRAGGIEALGFWLATVAVAGYFVVATTIMVHFHPAMPRR